MPGYYKALDGSYNDQINCYRKQIQKDIDRTAKNMSQDLKQKMMRILINFAKRNMKIAYCQGMNLICFFLIEMNFEEEAIFWILCYIFEYIMPPYYYIEMASVLADIQILMAMLRRKSSEISKNIYKNKIDLTYCFIPLFLTAFTGIQNVEVI
jgi:hypothetical protein